MDIEGNLKERLLKQLKSSWYLERHPTFPTDKEDSWRIITKCDRERWRKHNTSARTPYIAIVWGLDLAKQIVDEHNKSLKI